MQIVILAGGLGRRLPVAAPVPKPMVPIAGRPCLQWQVESLVAQGFNRILLLVGYLADSIVDHFGDGSRFAARIRYSRESQPLGTGGALRLALPKLEEAFLLMYGDSLLVDPVQPIARRLEADPVAGIMAVYRDEAGVTGVPPNVAVDNRGWVIRYRKEGSGRDLRYVEAGLVGLHRSFVAQLPDGVPSGLESDLYPQLVANRRIRAWRTRWPFFDIGTPERLERAERFLVEHAIPTLAQGGDGTWT